PWTSYAFAAIRAAESLGRTTLFSGSVETTLRIRNAGYRRSARFFNPITHIHARLQMSGERHDHLAVLESNVDRKHAVRVLNDTKADFVRAAQATRISSNRADPVFSWCRNQRRDDEIAQG